MNATEVTARVAIIGAGFSGIAAAVALRNKGIEDFVIFEKAPGIGGTWWSNRYPGAEVDLESHVYSFSYERSDWSRTHAGWRELQDYLSDVADKWDLPRRVRFNEAVQDVRWSDTDQTYTVVTTSGDDHGEFTAVISAVGFLNIPVMPPFARCDNDYQGAMCHTSSWIDGLDMAGKSVGIVGTGSSAVQVVTEAEKVASEVKIFQLEPNWIMPKKSRDFTALERRLNRLPPVYAWRRFMLYFDYDRRQFRSSHARSDGWFNKRGAIVVFAARLLPVVRTFIALPAGIARMKQLRFQFYTFVGSWPWCYGLAYVGEKLGQRWDSDPLLKELFHRFDAAVVVLLVAAAAWYVWSHLKHRVKAKG